MTGKIKFAIIGSGNIANTYCTAIGKIEEAEVVAVVSQKLSKPADFDQLPSYHTLDEIEMEFDAVIICTPNGNHHIGAIEAATLGKHVLCEKPIDISLESIDRMINACKRI